MNKLLLAIVLSATVSAPAFAARMTVNQHIGDARESKSLKAWSQKERVRLTAKNPGYKMRGPADLCAEMKVVGLDCSYNTRGNLVQYLYAHDVNLFPCEGGTNPYTRDSCLTTKFVDFYNYVGEPIQNRMLTRSIKKNRNLFRNGDLTADAASKWQK